MGIRAKISCKWRILSEISNIIGGQFSGTFGNYGRAAGMGLIFYRPPSIWMGILYTSKVYQWGIIFYSKSIWTGKMWKIVHE